MMETRSGLRLTAAQTAKFKRLAMPHLAVMLRTAGYLTRNGQEAEDLVQETMIKAMRAIDSFADGTDIKAWLMTILRRAHIDMVRAGKNRSQTVSIDQAELDVPDRSQAENSPFDAKVMAPEALLERFADKDIIEAIKELPEEIRWTLMLVDVEQMDHSAAATVLDVPVGTIKSRAHRGRAMLRDRLYRWALERGWVSDEASSHA